MAHPSHHFGVHIAVKKKQKNAIDKLAYIAGVGGNIAVIPQIIKAWSSDAPGMAVLTWVLFVLMGIIWLVYAIIHKAKPLIIAQAVGLTCNTCVVLGWLINTL